VVFSVQMKRLPAHSATQVFADWLKPMSVCSSDMVISEGAQPTCPADLLCSDGAQPMRTAPEASAMSADFMALPEYCALRTKHNSNV
jgi:hypothetical protein